MKLKDILEARDTDFNRDGWYDALETLFGEADTPHGEAVKFERKNHVITAMFKGKKVAEWDVSTNKGWIDAAGAGEYKKQEHPSRAPSHQYAEGQGLEPEYVIRRGKTSDEFEVAKFDHGVGGGLTASAHHKNAHDNKSLRARGGPAYVAYVVQLSDHKYTSTSEGFKKVGQKDKTVVMVKAWIKAGMPTGVYYTWDEAKRAPVTHDAPALKVTEGKLGQLATKLQDLGLATPSQVDSAFKLASTSATFEDFKKRVKDRSLEHQGLENLEKIYQTVRKAMVH